jgi:hypothetical protein
MADMYASVLGTMVIRHRSVPSRPASLDGEVVVREYAADKAAHPDHICSRSGMDPIVGIRYHKRGDDQLDGARAEGIVEVIVERH